MLMFTREVGDKYGASDSKSTLDIGIAQRTSAAPGSLKRLEVNPNLTLGNLCIQVMASTAFPVKQCLWILRSVKCKSSKMERNSLAAHPVLGSRQ